MPARTVRSTAALGLAAVLLAACGQSEGAGGQPSDGAISVVASTNVWASVVEAVGGDAVDVTAIIEDPSADPHSYESTPSDAASVQRAELVVFNGGGYDEFIERILGATGDAPPTVQAYQPDGEHQDGGHEGHRHEHDHAATNEHIWYELPAVGETAERVAQRLGELRPAQAGTFTDNAAQFRDQLSGLEGDVSQVSQAHGGERVIATAPIAAYLIEDAGLTDTTPPEFVEAVEEGSDPPAAAIAEVEQQLGSGTIAALIHNPQTETPGTQRIRTTAADARIPVVDMTETLPPDTDYLTWMGDQIQALTTALNG